jgi:hypothetical protein
MNNPFTMLKTVAEGLGSIREDVVFTGGATVSLYVTGQGGKKIQEYG